MCLVHFLFDSDFLKTETEDEADVRKSVRVSGSCLGAEGNWQLSKRVRVQLRRELSGSCVIMAYNQTGNANGVANCASIIQAHAQMYST